MNTKAFISFLGVTIHCFVVTARPDGSPVCTVGSAAPQSLHLSRQPGFLGGISVGKFEVKIGDTVLDSTSINEIPGGANLTLDMRSTDGGEFRGVLIILNKDGVDLSSNLFPTVPGFKEQTSCSFSGYSGFTHSNRDLKQFAQGSITMPANQEAFLDVNIVVANNFVKGSIFHHTRFQLLTKDTSSAPVKAPVRTTTPTSAPVKPPVRAPVKPPIRAPVKPPIRAPLKVPVKAPTKSPVEAPTNAPTSAPVKPPVRAPMQTPVRAPVKPPVRAPMKIPVKAPTRKPRKPPISTPVNAPVSTPEKPPVRVPVKDPVRTPAKTPVRVPAQAPAPVPAPRKSPVRAPVRVPLTAPIPSPVRTTNKPIGCAASPV